jgi:hypothetical protein
VLSFLFWQEDSGSLLFRRFVLLFSWEWSSPSGYRPLSNKESLAAKWGKHIGLEVDVCVYPEPVSLLITNSGEVRVSGGLPARVWTHVSGHQRHSSCFLRVSHGVPAILCVGKKTGPYWRQREAIAGRKTMVMRWKNRREKTVKCGNGAPNVGRDTPF